MSTPAAAEAAALFADPPKPSHHPEDAPSRSPTPDSASPSNRNGHASNPTVPTNLPPTSAANGANTGPKGVLADARAFERAWHARRKSPGAAGGGGGGSTSGIGGAGMWPFSRDEKKRQSGSRHSTPERGRDDEGRSRSETGSPGRTAARDGDDDFMDQWRKARLSELRTSSQQPKSRRQSPSLRRYGRVEMVNAVGYLDAIERVGRDTIVVVCIYDDESDTSQQVEDHLSSIAAKHPTTRFVKLHYLEAEMDVISAPAILAYKEGELFANLVAVANEVPRDTPLAETSLEGVLRTHNILP